MKQHTQMLAYGQFAPAEQASLLEAAGASAVALFTTASTEEATRWLDDNDVAGVLLGEGDGQEGLALGTRAQSRHRQLPILALTRHPSDLEFAGAYSWGADDVVAPDQSRPLTTRLRALTAAKAGEQPIGRGTAVIAEVDQSRRVATARALFNTGYDVRFAVTSKDMRNFSLEEGVTLVVLCTELCEDPPTMIGEMLAAGSSAKFIVSAEPRRYNELSQALARTKEARITDASAPPENVVFLSNELASGPMPNKRAAPRLLYGTTVRFRGEGRDEDDIGFSYNVSEGGLYVRTLAPPTDDVVWLELTPPKYQKRVRLVGEVAWRRPFGPHGSATVPPGFGVRIIDGGLADRKRWTQGCGQAATELLTASLLPPERTTSLAPENDTH